ncbi:hypothetical protein ZIOFF_056566 [Zingiber officinale]|uniref:Uncharacterized protein n=1 Tax=Zingiber officinale TaxID=94328 RepID=A0A8J5FI26_ZINOF|nr:hypothetical protein ZIOFF_056566 [Zingiber officinale]
MLLSLAMVLAIKKRSARLRRSISYAYHALSRYNIRSININEMAFHSDRQCVDNCRMDRRSLSKLCYLLTTRGKLKGNRNMSINELVISFLHIIAHNVKNRVLKRQTGRSGETISSRQFHLILNYILRLHNILLKKPEPIPENCTDDKWKWFKGCLGALDETYINVNVPANDKPREGSAADGRVLRDAISRRNGLKIPQGANAETPADAVEEINLCDEEVDTSNAEIFAEYYKGEESNDANQTIRKSETLDSSICPSNKKPTTRKRKGKANDALDDLVGEIHKYVIAVTEANEEMKGISTYFKKQTESDYRKMKIYDELTELSEFSEQEIMDVGEYILKDEHKIDNFFALPKAFRRNYILDGRMLKIWTDRAVEIKQHGWFWEYSLLGVTIDGITVSLNGCLSTVEATIEESAKLTDDAHPEYNDSCSTTYTTRYEMTYTKSGWKITEEACKDFDEHLLCNVPEDLPFDEHLFSLFQSFV